MMASSTRCQSWCVTCRTSSSRSSRICQPSVGAFSTSKRRTWEPSVRLREYTTRDVECISDPFWPAGLWSRRFLLECKTHVMSRQRERELSGSEVGEAVHRDPALARARGRQVLERRVVVYRNVTSPLHPATRSAPCGTDLQGPF